LARSVWNKGGVEAEAQLIQKLAEFTELAETFKASGSNIGRMLRAFRVKIADLGEDFEGVSRMLLDTELGDGTTLTSENIREMARRIAQSNNPSIAIRKEADRFNPDWKNYALSLYYNGLLGSWSVQAANIKGNFYHQLQSLVTDSLGLVGSAARGIAKPEAERLLLGEVAGRWKGTISATLNPATWRAVISEFTAP